MTEKEREKREREREREKRERERERERQRERERERGLRGTKCLRTPRHNSNQSEYVSTYLV